jgi:hypothetical protein
MRVVEKYLKKQLDILWENSLLHPMDFQRKQQEFNLARSFDPWWEGRDWIDSLPPEKGGITTQLHVVGKDITILSLGSSFATLEVRNTGKISLRGWDLAITQGPTKLNSVPETVDNREIPPDDREKLTFAIGTPEESFFSSDSWDLTGKLKVNVRPTWSAESGEWRRNRTKIRGSLRLLIKGRRKQPWLAIDVEVTARPFREEYAVNFVVAFVNF